MENHRKRLSDILQNDDKSKLQSLYQKTEAAGDFLPLPGGEYPARIVSGRFFTSKEKGTPGYKLTFEVTEGEFQGRRCWYDVWLTSAAMPLAKRDLGKLGVTDLDQLDSPLPEGILCKVRVKKHQDDDKNEYNQVRSFEVTGVEKEPFAPEPEKGEPQP